MKKLEWVKENGIYRADNGTIIEKLGVGVWYVTTQKKETHYSETLKGAKLWAEKRAFEKKIKLTDDEMFERMQHYLYD